MKRAWFVAVMLWACVAQATMIVYQTDAELFAKAEVVAVAEIWRREPMRRGSSVFTDYELEITESLKGPLRAGTFTFVRTIGGELEDGEGTYVAGAPHPPEHSTVVVFLSRQPDGIYTLTGFTLGHHELRYDARLRRYFAHRDIDAIEVTRRSPTRDGVNENVTIPADRLASQVIDELRQMAVAR